MNSEENASPASEQPASTSLTADESEPGRSDLDSALDAGLTDDLALALLNRRDLPAQTVEQIGKITSALKSRKVCITLASHPHAPRRLSLRLIRQFYTFDLMHFALNPAVAAGLRRFAEDMLIARIPSMALGERLSLARRSPNIVAAALLLDKESRVFRTALDNGRLTEATVVKTLVRSGTTASFVEAVCRHSKWSVRREVRIALLRSQHTPLARALEFARTLPPPLLRDVLHASRLPEKIKEYLRRQLDAKK
jgi:hypothetical protein